MQTIIRKITNFTLAITMLAFIFACDKEEDTPPPGTINYSNGIFVVNEGPFNSGSGTVTWFNKNGTGREEKLFQKSNNLLPLGNLAQSMNVIVGAAYIVVNNANLVRVVSLKTFKEMHTIENVSLPRYIEYAGDNTSWITSWDNRVLVYDMETGGIIDDIPTGTGPERLLKIGSEMWVLNQGGFGIDSTITVIDIQSREVAETLQVYPKPTGIQLDHNGYVWIMCSGHGWNGWPDPSDTEGHLICIDPFDYSVIKDFSFPTSSDHPEKLLINADDTELYFVYPGGIYRHDVDAADFELQPLIQRPGVFYSIDYDPENQILYATDAGDFQQNGWVYRYQHFGTLIDSLEAGIGPTDICIP